MLKHEKVVDEVSNRLNVPRELVHVVMIDFFHNLRYALMNPCFELGIKLKSIFKIKINPTRVLQDLDMMQKYDYINDRRLKLLWINKNLINNEIYTEKQSKVAYEFEGLRPQIEERKRSLDIEYEGRYFTGSGESTNQK